MRLAIDASRVTVAQRTGTENYARQLLVALLPLMKAYQVTLYFRDQPVPGVLPDLPNVEQQIIPWPRLWTHVRLAAALWQQPPDVFWTPAHTLPRFFPGRAVVTLHDAGYLHFPQAHPPMQQRYLDWTTRFSAKRASQIMADSHATKADLIHYYGIAAEKITVVYPGVDENISLVRDEALKKRLRAKYGLPERYLLFVGTLQPRKNIQRLVQAFEDWRSRTSADYQDVVLALAGRPGPLFDPAWLANRPQVHSLGYVADSDLAALYSGALGFVFPSLFEGFGFPILEAMRCHLPVLCSNTSSLPELAGNAAILVNPLDTEAIAEGIRQLVENDERRAQFIQAGSIQAQQFTWERAAQQALQVLQAAAQ